MKTATTTKATKRLHKEARLAYRNLQAACEVLSTAKHQRQLCQCPGEAGALDTDVAIAAGDFTAASIEHDLRKAAYANRCEQLGSEFWALQRSKC